ncbi:hypothetical protein BOO86_21610 [Mycobacterium sp. CBMA 234]|nr:hypothetical protein [Mycolicibacterium sp. CBMA 234]
MKNANDPSSFMRPAAAVTKTALRLADWAAWQFSMLIRAGIDTLEPMLQQAAPVLSESTSAPSIDSLNSKMRSLLDRALDQSARDSELELFEHILSQLVADEARIVSALSDGSMSPVINVYAWTRSRTVRHPVLENASLIGRTANVALVAMVPAYVSHLLSLKLIEIGPEEPGLAAEYEVLAAESIVMKAIKGASVGPLAAKVERLTVRLSALGREMWATVTQTDIT